MSRTLLLALLVSPLLAAPEGTDDSRRLGPDRAPTPYSAEEIKKACAEGRTDTFRIERGKETWKHTIKFTKCDAQGAEVESTNTTEDGKSTTSKDRQLWTDFQAHGSFPEADTKITEETIEVPAGKFECLLYTVQKRDGDPATVRMYFAKKLAGPPVKYTSEQMGKVVFTMTLLEHKDGTPKEGEKAPEKGKD